MDDNISYIAFEAVCSRFERMNKRLWIMCIILAIMLITTNIAWIHYVQQFEAVTTTIETTQDLDATDGGDAIINDGVHINGESTADSTGNEN